MLGTQQELASRVNSSGSSVVHAYKMFVNDKDGYQKFKNNFNENGNRITKEEFDKLDKKVQVLGDVVKDLERTIQVSNDPRFRRHYH